MLNVRTVYRMECDKCGRIASDYSDWFQDKDGRTYCGPCAGKVEGLEPLGNPRICCELCEHPFDRGNGFYVHHPEADGCDYCDELNDEGAVLCEECHHMLIVYGYTHSRWYWGDLAFAIDDRTACVLWRAVWQPERVTVEQAQTAWEYATRSDNQTIMDAASLEPGDALCGESWNTIGEFLARDADAYARWYRTTPEDVAARCLEWVDWLGVWMLKPMERYEAEASTDRNTGGRW